MADANQAAALDGFPAFPDGCNSLLKKYLTRDVWEQLKHRKTSAGVTLHDCIRSGIASPDSEIGLYAGDAESYDVFAPLFEPVIADCHPGFRPGDAPQGDPGTEYFRPANPDSSGKYIVSTRIRLARNVRGYNLRPIATRDADLEIEGKVKGAFATFSGDLAGRYHEMRTLSGPADTSLPASHSFKRGDRFQDAAGLNQNWPDGRGVFANATQTFFSWVNEEDHLRFISMQRNGDVAAVYGRLRAAMDAVARCLMFQKSDRYGYLTSCPSNLGTGLRLSFNVRLPLSGRSPEFDAICERRHLTVRGIAGEGSAISGDVYNVSNKRRLGLSEAQCLQECLDGLLNLIDLEKSLEDRSNTLTQPTTE